MIRVEIDLKNFVVEPGASILEICELVGGKIPKFCYHQSLSVAGNCRMCLVEIINTLKPVASCALPILNNIRVLTNSPLIKKSRENVLELLLINHPLDCPICDQGGECDLQDLARKAGFDFSRYIFPKRVVEDKNMGLLIKTIMTRCIHCTRCVRFNSEISGNDFIGTLGRGVLTEIGPYISSSSYNSQISANVIDLCPVGALTSKPYSFKARPWELRTQESIDLTDGFSSPIYVSSKESEIVRIFPKVGAEVNERFISDKCRFYFDSNSRNRLLDPLVSANDEIDVESCLDIKNLKTLFLTNNNNDMNTLLAIKTFENFSLKKKTANIISNNISNSSIVKSNFYTNWINSSLYNLKDCNSLCFLISSDLNLESSILNTKIRNKKYTSNFLVFGFSGYFNTNFDLKILNISLTKFYAFLESKCLEISFFFLKFKTPLIIVSDNLFKRGSNFDSFYLFIKNIIGKVEIIKTQNTCNLEGSNFLNYSKSTSRTTNFIDNLVCVNLEESFALKKYFFKKIKTIIWLSTHNSEILTRSLNNNIFYFPIRTEFEESKAFINLEQKIQKTAKIVSPLNDLILSPKKIFFEIFNLDQSKKEYKLHINFYREMLRFSSLFSALNSIKFFFDLPSKSCYYKKRQFFFISSYPVKKFSEDSYLLNKMLKNSKILAQCSRVLREKCTNFGR